MLRHIKSNSPIFILFFSIALILSSVFFDGLSRNQFMYLGDHLLRFNFFDSYSNSFFLRKWENLGVHNGWQFTVQFWDALLYILLYSFGSTVQFVERLFFLLIIFWSLSISYIGFLSWSVFLHFSQGYKTKIIVIATACWFCFNPYAVMLWHGGVFNVGLSLMYSASPLIILLFYKTVFLHLSIRQALILSLLLLLSFFTFWLFAPLAFTLFLLFIIHLFFHLRNSKVIFLRIMFISISTIVLLLPFLFAVTHELANNVNDMNSMFTPTYGNQQGGLLYVGLFLFSWGIYTIWTPRAMYSFYQFYFSQPYLWGILNMYIGLLIGGFWYVYRSLFTLHFKGFNKENRSQVLIFISLVVILLISYFFAKGAQPPYGNIFVFLYDHVPFFNVFRTPDIRFGFSIVLIISILFIFIARYIHWLLFTFFVFIFIFMQSSILFTGVAVQGQNEPGKFYDRIVHIPESYLEITDYIHNNSSAFSYVFVYPPYENGNYMIDSDHHFGQDILPRIIKKPFLYLSESSGISKDSFYSIKTILDDEDFVRFEQFPIEYFIIRNDYQCSSCQMLNKKKVEQQFELVFSNKNFEVYKSRKFIPLLSGTVSDFSIINPTAYRVDTSTSMGSTKKLVLAQSYNSNWKVYRLPEWFPKNFSYLFINPLIDLLLSPAGEGTHQLYEGYANSWVVEEPPQKTNSYLILYKPQVWYVGFLFSTIIITLIYIVYLFRSRKNSTFGF